MQELESIIKFIKLTHDFQKIERVTLVAGTDRMENDAEHSYQLALVGWYLVSTYKLPLNADLVVKYGLIHDLVEVYAGDTYAFDKDPSVHASKVQREQEALRKLQIEFPEFNELTDLISAYEKHEDEESRFIYALDKVVAPINIYLDGGGLWKVKKVTFQEMLDNKTEKVAAHPEVKKYFEQLVKLLEQEQHLFHQDENKES